MKDLTISFTDGKGVDVQLAYDRIEDFMNDVRRGGRLCMKLDCKNITAKFFGCELLELEFPMLKDLCDYCRTMTPKIGV